MMHGIDKRFCEYSKDIGENLNIIQGAGGNTSIKDGDILWVKASGRWLKDACSHDIFVPVGLRNVIKNIENGDIDPVSTERIVLDEMDGSLRPSIETTLHALLPHKYVVHTHSVNAISVAVLIHGKEFLTEKLDGLKWEWVPYARPGLPLSNNVRMTLVSNPDILILQNHGIVFGSNNIDDLILIFDELEEKLKSVPRITNVNCQELGLPIVDGYEWSMDNTICSLAFDAAAQRLVLGGTLYPDHVVFLGLDSISVIDINGISDVNNNVNVVIVKGKGVLIRESLSEGAMAMVYCLASVVLRIHSNAQVCYLTREQENELINWDAEKYRQMIQNV